LQAVAERRLEVRFQGLEFACHIGEALALVTLNGTSGTSTTPTYVPMCAISAPWLIGALG